MAQYELTRRARSDIAGIAQYSETNWGLARANKYLDALETSMRRLAANPLMSRPRDDLRVGLRSFGVQSHIIYFRTRGKAIVIVRVLHMAQDPSLHL